MGADGKRQIVLVIAFDRTMSGEIKPAFAPHECKSEQQARHLAVDLSTRHWGVLAWMLTRDPRTRCYGAPIEIVRYGAVPANRNDVYRMVRLD